MVIGQLLGKCVRELGGRQPRRRRNLGWRLLSLTTPRLRTPYRNQSSGLLPEGGEIELILLEITEDEMLCPHLSHRVIVHLIEGVHWVVVNPFLLLLLLPLLPLPDVRIVLECSLCMKSDKAHLLKQTRARQMRRASRRTEQVTPMAIVFSSEPFIQR